MASIQKRTTKAGAVSYRVEIRLKGYPAQRATFERLTDARKWSKQTESAIMEGRHFKTTEARRHTLAEMADRYFKWLESSPTKLRDRGHHIRWWKEQLGNYALSDVTPALIAEYRDKLAATPVPGGRPRSPASVKRYLAYLSHAFSMAVKEWGWIDDNPCRKVTKPTEPRGRVRFLSDEERDRLLMACRESSNPDLYAAVVLALSTGARKMEIMGLRWPQVDLSRGVITLEETKNGERRVLPLAGAALLIMRERKKVRHIATDLVFPGHNIHKPTDLRAPWEAALKAAEIADFRWHDLRHSTVSYLAMSGASLAEIAEVLGHKTLSMVKRYSHLSESHVAGVVARMNDRYLP
jgi:integrase